MNASKRSSRFWLFFIAGLLAINFTIVAVTVVLATGSSTVAIEPDYYDRAIHFDSVMQERARSDALGWNVTVHAACETSLPGRLTVEMRDRDGEHISDAEVEVVAFPSVRATERQSATLFSSGDGRYASAALLNRAGWWRLQLRARRGEEVHVLDTDLYVPSP